MLEFKKTFWSQVIPADIRRQIMATLIPTLDIPDKITWKFMQDGNFILKSITWANNDNISPHHRAKLLHGIWKLNLLPKMKIFAWRLIIENLPTRVIIGRHKEDIDENSHFCNNGKEELGICLKVVFFIETSGKKYFQVVRLLYTQWNCRPDKLCVQ